MPKVCSFRHNSPSLINESAMRSRIVVLDTYDAVIRKNKRLDEVFEKTYVTKFAHTTIEEKKLCYALLLMLIRRQRQYRQIISGYLKKALRPKESFVLDVLTLGCCELIHFNIPAYATIHTLVNIVKKSQFKHLSALTNAILRQIERQKLSFEHITESLDNILPHFLYERYTNLYGDIAAQNIAKFYLKPPYKDLTFVIPPNEERIKQLNAYRLPTASIRLRDINVPIVTLPGYDQGEFFVQSAASYLISHILPDNLSNKYVLDIGAAPGGKTIILALKNAFVTAIDKNEGRVKKLIENLNRMKIKDKVTVITQDIIKWQKESKNQYDYVIIDAPCSATGTLRKNPEIPWLKKTKDNLNNYCQKEILESASLMVKPNGYMIYAVCSIEAEEAEERIEKFIATHKNFCLSPINALEIHNQKHFINNNGCIRTMPFMRFDLPPNSIAHKEDVDLLEGMEGFFIARLQKLH